ncbi:MAG: T9SS type A sorting domain-containing protein, partial [Crocinitomicaceae bacterium]|nr:T9SS type A sorting domain-containing protein [Crocinitomicaceae bacterium]
GASGGMDDRFDFVLHSENLGQGNPSLHYIEGTYMALGNNGTCYNQDLINCTTVNNVPDTILSALYHLSDHLPVVFSLSSDAILATPPIEKIKPSIYPNPTENQLTIKVKSNETLTFQLRDITGNLLYQEDFNSILTIDVSDLSQGIYHGLIIKNNLMISMDKILIE